MRRKQVPTRTKPSREPCSMQSRRRSRRDRRRCLRRRLRCRETRAGEPRPRGPGAAGCRPSRQTDLVRHHWLQTGAPPPGDPAAAFVCAHLFLRHLVNRSSARDAPMTVTHAALDGELRENPVESYPRAHASVAADARWIVRPFENQDTSLVSVFAAANAFIRRTAGGATGSARRSCRGCAARQRFISSATAPPSA